MSSGMIRVRRAAVSIALVAAATAALGASAAEYAIDPSHAFVQFRISHLGYSTMVGRFNTFAGGFSWDKSNPSAASIEVTIDAASIDTNWAERDKHLRGEEFLDVATHPKADFKSTKYTGDAAGGKLEGNLTLHGVTRPIVLEVKPVGEGEDPWGGYRAGFSATTTLKRADFGLSYDLGPAAEAMQFDLFIEGIRK